LKGKSESFTAINSRIAQNEKLVYRAEKRFNLYFNDKFIFRNENVSSYRNSLKFN